MNKTMKRLIGFFIVVLVFCLIIFLLIFKHSEAKYVDYVNWEHGFYTNGFFITSDLLGKDTITTAINEYFWDGINLKVKNYDGKYKVTDYDVSYELKCEVEDKYNKDFSCLIDEKDEGSTLGILKKEEKCFKDNQFSDISKDECINKGNVFKSAPIYNEHTLKVINKTKQDIDSLKLKITLTTTDPYKTILDGEVNINFLKSGKVNYKIKNENKRYCDIAFFNEGIDTKQIELVLDTERFLLDTGAYQITEYMVDKRGFVNKFNLSIPSSSQIDFKLLKKKDSYNCNDAAISYSILS